MRIILLILYCLILVKNGHAETYVPNPHAGGCETDAILRSYLQELHQVDQGPHVTLAQAANDLRAKGVGEKEIKAILEGAVPKNKNSTSLFNSQFSIPFSSKALGASSASGNYSYWDGARVYQKIDTHTYDVSSFYQIDSTDIALRRMTEEIPEMANSNPDQLPYFWALPVDAKGKGHPPGHPHNPYYISHNSSDIIPGYKAGKIPHQLEDPGPLLHMKKVELRPVPIVSAELSATKKAYLPPQSEQAFYELLEKSTGIKKHDLIEIPPPLIGEGGVNYVFKICPKLKKCFVMKLKKLLSGASVSEEQERLALEIILHDAFMEEKQKQQLRYASYKGRPVAKVAGGPYPQSLSYGVVTQDFVSWEPLNRSMEIYSSFLDKGEKVMELRKNITSAVMAHKNPSFFQTYQEYIDDFLLRTKYYKTKTGPDFESIDEYLNLCQYLAAAEAVVRICNDFIDSYNLKDFKGSAHAVESFYRDTASSVIKDRRKSFKSAVFANSYVEVGYDYNHGANVFWDPPSGGPIIGDR